MFRDFLDKPVMKVLLPLLTFAAFFLPSAIACSTSVNGLLVLVIVWGVVALINRYLLLANSGNVDADELPGKIMIGFWVLSVFAGIGVGIYFFVVFLNSAPGVERCSFNICTTGDATGLGDHRIAASAVTQMFVYFSIVLASFFGVRLRHSTKTIITSIFGLAGYLFYIPFGSNPFTVYAITILVFILIGVGFCFYARHADDTLENTEHSGTVVIGGEYKDMANTVGDVIRYASFNGVKISYAYPMMCSTELKLCIHLEYGDGIREKDIYAAIKKVEKKTGEIISLYNKKFGVDHIRRYKVIVEKVNGVELKK